MKKYINLILLTLIFPLLALGQSLKNDTTRTVFCYILADEDNDTISNPPFIFVDQMPVLEGGLPLYLSKNIHYPDKASKMGIEGKVWVQLIIENNGKVSNVELSKGIGFGCDEEALRVISQMPDWIPGENNGKKVRVRMKVSVNFRLN